MRKNFKDVGFYPQPVLIIGTYDADGVPDAMNVGWGGLVGGGYVEINISQGHKTTENLRLKGAFTVSFADRAHLTEADYVGLVSGHTTPDKIARAGLTPVRSAFVDAPLFEEFAPPTTPAGCPAGAGACTTAPAACGLWARW